MQRPQADAPLILTGANGANGERSERNANGTADFTLIGRAATKDRWVHEIHEVHEFGTAEGHGFLQEGTEGKENHQTIAKARRQGNAVSTPSSQR